MEENSNHKCKSVWLSIIGLMVFFVVAALGVMNSSIRGAADGGVIFAQGATPFAMSELTPGVINATLIKQLESIVQKNSRQGSQRRTEN